MSKKAENSLVSICIPTYNGEKYLRQCLDSCLDQDFKDYEIIICDDGSQDGSIAILESYATMHSQITLVKNEKNLGLVENWNKCISFAKGKWIKFVFQDDYITKDCLSVFTDAIDERSHLIVCQRNFSLPENADNEMKTYYTQTVRTLENTGYYVDGYFTPKQLGTIAMQNMCMNFIGEPSLIFFKKETAIKLGLFNVHLKQICDFEFALRMGTNYGLKYLPKKLCTFRIHNDSTTNSNISTKYFILRYIEPLIYSYLLIFNEHFKSFRANLSLPERFKLKLYFKVKAYHAFKINTEQALHHSIFYDSNPIFGEIRKIKNGDVLTRLVAIFKK